ncbi:15835_t:CDS:1, partial [Acaulospora morrowiae]
MSDIYIPNIFKGTVIKRDDVNYESECYQYASSSYLKEDIVRPMAIIKAADDNDVINAIKFAKENNIAIAVRTGGHQYSGASSTNGKNIQLDLSQTYKDFQWNNEDRTSVTLGVSFSLGEFNAKLGEASRFVPHGQCQYINIGGHVQTGGYGQLARSFGLFSDYVEKFSIITADGQKQEVNHSNKDLFFAVLGGSPGNFGVLTHVTLKVLRDQDYPNSRGLRAVCPYNRDRLKELLDIMVDMAENKDFPADYDYSVTVLEDPPHLTTSELTYDQRYNHKYVTEQLITWPRVIIIFVQWANLKGARQIYDQQFIDKIRKAAGITIINAIKLVIVSDRKPTPISKLTSHWIVPIGREFNLPYFKRVYSSNSNSKRLKSFKWTDWVSRRIDDGYTRKLNLSAQFQHFGGNNSRFFRNGKNSHTSFSWRDMKLCYTLDVFYHTDLYKEAKMWVQRNDYEGVGNSKAKFCEDDRRLLWGSYDLDLSANWLYYYDKKAKYNQLCKIKEKYDPSGVFTPNRFCIGLPVPKGKDTMQPRITPADLEEIDSDEHQLRAEEKFWKIMNKEIDKPVCLWDTWHDIKCE